MTKTREDVLDAYPNAFWMPWDKCPIGKRVLRRADCDGKREMGVLIGTYNPPPKTKIHCLNCSCIENDPFLDWWKIKLESGMDVIEYPPSLTPIEADKVDGGQSESGICSCSDCKEIKANRKEIALLLDANREANFEIINLKREIKQDNIKIISLTDANKEIILLRDLARSAENEIRELTYANKKLVSEMKNDYRCCAYLEDFRCVFLKGHKNSHMDMNGISWTNSG